MHVRRQDRLMDESESWELLRNEAVGYLALTDDQEPYVLPFNYLLEGKNLYPHCATAGRKLDIIAQNPRFCFAVSVMDDVKAGPSACDYGTYYRSVLAFGSVKVVADEEEKVAVLTRLTEKYVPEGMSFTPVTPERAQGTVVLSLEIHRITGKSRRP